MIKRKLINIIFFLTCAGHLTGQEVVTGLTSNPLLKNKRSQYAKSLSADTLKLPFFDDFSGHEIFPDKRKWSDEYVFINNTYSDKQVTTGIATFDALNSSGRLYETASDIVFRADYLTSQPVDLNFPASENIWLSFYYQPGGLGDLPEENDTLTLHFYAPEEMRWYSVWRVSGDSTGKFKPVILKIDQARFLKKGFRFRFINYASLSPNKIDPSMIGNCDHWNIDYVLLDRNRNEGDTIFPDVAFRKPFRSLLKNHEAMPLKHFNKIYLQEMGATIPISYRNNDTIIRNVTRNFRIWDVYKNSEAVSFSAGATNINPLTSVDYNANLFYTFNTNNEDSALFKVTSWLVTDDFDPKGNDTVVYYQRFSNYFAFDDGSAEAGYGINGLGSRNAMVAFRFRSFTEDTLRAISICFNDSYMNANQRIFGLMVWNDNNGLPGDVIYSRQEVMLEQGNDINGFHTYFLPSGVAVKNYFYVGWKQRSETFLNAGFDVNTPHRGNLLYWMNGNWFTSQKSGTLMIRPVVGPPVNTSVNDIYYKTVPLLNFFPNPATDYITFDPKDLYGPYLYEVAIYDIHGRELIKVRLDNKVDISSLKTGIYIVTLRRNGRPAGYSRLIKSK
ncbi:MAG TPA: hypothetical protein DDW27_21860 [Bacteroidales bacterium]|nr:hypothetical protein [Bacteroidales bacterium]